MDILKISDLHKPGKLNELKNRLTLVDDSEKENLVNAITEENWFEIYKELISNVEFYEQIKVLDYMEQDIDDILDGIYSYGIDTIAQEMVNKYHNASEDIFDKEQTEPIDLPKKFIILQSFGEVTIPDRDEMYYGTVTLYDYDTKDLLEHIDWKIAHISEFFYPLIEKIAEIIGTDVDTLYDSTGFIPNALVDYETIDLTVDLTGIINMGLDEDQPGINDFLSYIFKKENQLTEEEINHMLDVFNELNKTEQYTKEILNNLEDITISKNEDLDKVIEAKTTQHLLLEIDLEDASDDEDELYTGSYNILSEGEFSLLDEDNDGWFEKQHPYEVIEKIEATLAIHNIELNEQSRLDITEISFGTHHIEMNVKNNVVDSLVIHSDDDNDNNTNDTELEQNGYYKVTKSIIGESYENESDIEFKIKDELIITSIDTNNGLVYAFISSDEDEESFSFDIDEFINSTKQVPNEYNLFIGLYYIVTKGLKGFEKEKNSPTSFGIGTKLEIVEIDYNKKLLYITVNNFDEIFVVKLNEFITSTELE